MLLGLLAAASIAIAACGGGAAATAGPAGSRSSNAPAGAGGATEAPGGVASQAAGGAGGAQDPCSLLTADDIKAVTGHAVSKATDSPHGGIFPAGCEWELIAPDESVPPTILLGIMAQGGKAYYEQYFEPYNQEQGNTPIAGLGDKAVDSGFSTVLVVKGDTFFNLQYLQGDLGPDSGLQVELAKKLVAHLS